MDSVNSRDIKCAVSGLRHLPGFFLCFLCSHFFSCDFYATFFDEQPVWVSTILSLFKVLLGPSSSHSHVPGILSLIFNIDKTEPVNYSSWEPQVL